MSYHYTDASRESDPHARTDVQVFHSSDACWYEPEDFPNDECPGGPGYYYAFGSPGCLWDSEPVGPFGTRTEALKAAREDAGFCEHGVAHDAVCRQCPAPELWVISGRSGAAFLHYSWGALNGGSCAAWTSQEAAYKAGLSLAGAGMLKDWEVVRLSDDEAREWGQ